MPDDLTSEFCDLTGGRLKQTPSELQVCAAVIRAHAPRVFVEVGSWEGGTLFVYARCCADPQPLVIAVDGARLGSAERLARTVELLRAEGVDAHWVRGDSHAAGTLAQVRDLLGGREVDFLHVDGDHSKKGVMQDWRTYGPLLRPGGLAAFHDILAKAPCYVRYAWQEIRDQGAAWCELVGPARQRTGSACGIGLVWTHRNAEEGA